MSGEVRDVAHLCVWADRCIGMFMSCVCVCVTEAVDVDVCKVVQAVLFFFGKSERL
jgi:hypothetical protein